MLTLYVIFIYVFPSPSDIKLSDAYNQNSNQLIIECVTRPSSDTDDYKVKWYRDDIEIRPTSVSSGVSVTAYEQEFDRSSGCLKLIVTYPTSSDCGLYRCVIMDRNFKKVDETSHLVYKIFNPQPAPSHDKEQQQHVPDQSQKTVFEKSLIDVTAEEGSSSVELKCRISSYYCNSDVIWLKDGKEIFDNNKYQTSKTYNRLTLNILNAEKSDDGVYECSVTNQGFVESTKCHVSIGDRKEYPKKGEDFWAKNRKVAVLNFKISFMNFPFFSPLLSSTSKFRPRRSYHTHEQSSS